MLLGFSSFAASEPASARYTFRLATDPAGTMQTPSVLKAGEACYFKDGGSGRNRWGDYSATVVDPTDDTKLWTLQEYAALPSGSDRWGTWWGMLDPTPAIAVTDPFTLEGDTGTSQLTFDVSLSVPTSQTVSVQWKTNDAAGTAKVADNDYVAVASGTVTFAPGETTKSFQVVVNGDVKLEPNETVYVDLSAPVNATLPDPQAVGTIGNDDAAPQISVGDRQVLEGSPSGTTPADFAVTLSNPSASTVTVNYNVTAGTATPGSVSPADYMATAGTVTFTAGQVSQTVTVTVLRDTNVEPDETFFVNLSAPVGGTILKATGNGVILNDDPAPSLPGVTVFTVASDGGTTAGSGRNRLEWVNPVTTVATGIRIRQSVTTLPTACTYPATVNDGSGVVNLAFGGSGTTQSYTDSNLNLGDDYCYSVFVEYPGPAYSVGASAQGKPFNAVSGKIRWKYFTGLGATTVAPPTVGQDGVLVPSNDFLVHAMTRGAAGGNWPAAWKPANLGSPAQARSPIVPFAGGSRAFYATQDGWVHALDAKTGAMLWETRLETNAGPAAAGAAPAGIFAAFGGAWDYLLVGTAESDDNRFYALDPASGAVLDYYPRVGDTQSGLGAILGMAAVDYARGQVYFGTRFGSSANTLWCLKLGPPSDALQFGWVVPRAAIGDIDGSPVVRGSRVYVGSNDGLLWSIQAADGAGRYSHTPSGPPEPIKGFPFPDRGSNALYFSTTTRVHSAVDNGAGNFLQKWNPQIGLTSPSPVLFWQAQDRLYVGLQAWGVPAGAWLYDIALRREPPLPSPWKAEPRSPSVPRRSIPAVPP